MRIQKLTIHNIASIIDAVIDFEAHPLADSEVFLITGKTGAGKSTILDAICLALYADTPRLKETKMEGDTQDGDHSVKTDDPRQLMRKNTGEAFVSLTFTGSNGIHYLATWSIARAYKKPQGKLQAKEWEWKNLDNPQLPPLRKDADIREEIKTAIGLDFDQFCRTTLLAQGEFTRFLNSKDEEKAKILEKITGVDIYSKIGAKVFERTSEKKQAWENAQHLVKETPSLSEEEIVGKENEIKALEQQQAALKKQFDEDKAKLKWIETDAQNSKEAASTAKAYDEMCNERNSEAFKSKETLVRQWNETIDARNWLSAKDKATREVAKQKETLSELKTAFTEVLKGLAAAEQEKQSLRKACDDLPQADEQKETENATRMKALRTQLDHAKELKQNLKTVNEWIGLHKSAKAQRSENEKKLAADRKEIESKKAERTALDPQIKEAEVKKEACKEVLDQQRDTIDKFAKAMRQRLHVGETCPVCRQTITSELPHEEALDQLVGQLSEAFTQAESAYNCLVDRKNKLDAWIETATKNHQAAQEALEKDRSVTQAAQKVIAGCQACGLENIDENTPKALESLNTKNEADLRDLENQIKALEQQMEAYQKQLQQRQKIELQLSRVTETCRMTQAVVDDLLLQQPAWRPLAAPSPVPCPDLSKKAAEVQRNTAAAQGQLEQATAAIQENGKLLQAFLDDHPDYDVGRLVALDRYSSQTMGAINTSLNEVKDKILTAQALKEEAARKLEAHRQAQPELNEEDTAEALPSRITATEETLTAIAEKRGALNEALKTDAQNKQRLGKLLEEAEQKHKVYLQWERMNQLIGDKTGNKFRKIAQSYVLSSLIHSANGYMRTLTDRYTLRVTPGTFVISIEDAYQGYASRAASTISGGESFLVSLSLALALSDIGQRLAVDTLFIDEGFGTLSGEPLQHAVNTLRSLHNKAGRHVGIISHVEELKERIPVQIRVEQEGNLSSSQVVIVPSET